MLAQKFNAGSGFPGVNPGTEAPIPGNTVNLDTVFPEACAKHGLNAADPELKSLLGQMVLDMAVNSLHLADFDMLIEECDPNLNAWGLYALQKLPAMNVLAIGQCTGISFCYSSTSFSQGRII